MLELRPYQVKSIEAIKGYFATNSGCPLVILPTGCGKSLVIAELIRDIVQQYSSTRFLVITHNKELVGQNHAEFKQLWPDAPTGVISAGLGLKQYGRQITFAGIQSVFRDPYAIGHVDAMLIDEAHTIPHHDQGMWRSFITYLKKINPKLRIIGLTATGFRLDSGRLTAGDNRIFTDIAYEYPILQAITDEYLCAVIPHETETHLSTAGVAKRGGEYVAGELERAFDDPDKTRAAIREVVKHGQYRKSWLGFAAGITHAGHIRDELRNHGILAEMVTGHTPKAERDRIIRDHKGLKIKALINVGIATTGYNHPALDLIFNLRATGSAGLWIQMVGRGMRWYGKDKATSLANGKVNCLLLDFAGNIERHGPIDQISGRDPKEKKGGDAPQKICPKCHAYCHAGAARCFDCDYVFPGNDVNAKLTETASNGPVFSNQLQSISYPVKSWDMHEHNKLGKKSLWVSYEIRKGPITTSATEWVSFESFGQARVKACEWWLLHGIAPVPNTVKEALERQNELRKPMLIGLAKEGKYDRIINKQFNC